jgi:hypothetical protein
MRRWSIVFFVLVVSTLALVAAGCGTNASTASLSPDTHSPEEILTAAYDAAYDLTSASGSFDLGLTVDADLSRVPDDALPFAQALVDGGINITGTYAYANEPMLADMSIAVSLMGDTLDVGLRLIEDKVWLSLGGQWYEAPAEMTQMPTASTSEIDVEKVRQMLADLGIDPVTWIKDLTVAGEETMDGVAVVRLEGYPDVMKLMNDSFQLLESEEFLALIDPSGALSAQLLDGGDMPSIAEIDEMRPVVEDMFAGMLFDLWVGKEDAIIRQMSMNGHLAPPADLDSEGFLGMDLTMTMSLTHINQVPAIESPTSALPIEALQQAVMNDPSLLGPFEELMGLMDYGVGGSVY